MSMDARLVEDEAYKLILSLPRANVASLQRKLVPLLKIDIVGSLPTELALHILSFLSASSLIVCGQVSRRWRVISDDPSLWKALCDSEGWRWRHQRRPPPAIFPSTPSPEDDEGVGDSDHEDGHIPPVGNTSLPPPSPTMVPLRQRLHTSAPPVLLSQAPLSYPNYKLLYRTHRLLRHRFRHCRYRLSALQTKGAPHSAHTHVIYCLQLYTYPSGTQVLFTGSRDRTIREWDLSVGLVRGIISGIHQASILSLCASHGFLTSAGGDRRVALFDLNQNSLVRTVQDHLDSVLCVRFNESWLVSCSKDWTLRIYKFPSLQPQFVLSAHGAAVNAVSISGDLIASASGDQSIRFWDAPSGSCIKVLENHSTRGIACIAFASPFLLSGSSDKHIRFLDFMTLKGWSSHPTHKFPCLLHKKRHGGEKGIVCCETCGSLNLAFEHPPSPTDQAETSMPSPGTYHRDLVRSVAIGEDVVSASYDLSIKVWDKRTGAFITDLTGDTQVVYSVLQWMLLK